jgi:cyclophilin family peptidyl-prolyl cis-trans isomerase
MDYFYETDFIIQFGIAATPEESQKWDVIIPDDPMYVQPNVQGTISYATAGPNTRTTQLFINLQDNQEYLDRMGFTPIGIIVVANTNETNTDPMKTVLPYIAKPNTKPDEDGIDQDHYMKYGNEWVLRHYPEVDMIINTTLVTVAVMDVVGDDVTKVPIPDTTNDDHVNSIGRISPPMNDDDENETVSLHTRQQSHRFPNRQYNNNDN